MVTIINTCSEISTGAPGMDIAFNIDLESVLGSGIKRCDGVIIPGKYQESGDDRMYVIERVVNLSGILCANKQLVTIIATPISADGNTVPASEITLAIPSGTELEFRESYFGNKK